MIYHHSRKKTKYLPFPSCSLLFSGFVTIFLNNEGVALGTIGVTFGSNDVTFDKTGSEVANTENKHM